MILDTNTNKSKYNVYIFNLCFSSEKGFGALFQIVPLQTKLRSRALGLYMIIDPVWQVCKYKRLTELRIEESGLGSLDNVVPGDCIVCFSKNDIYNVSIFLIYCEISYNKLAAKFPLSMVIIIFPNVVVVKMLIVILLLIAYNWFLVT